VIFTTIEIKEKPTAMPRHVFSSGLFLLIAAASIWSVTSGHSVNAANWMFRASYYSHSADPDQGYDAGFQSHDDWTPSRSVYRQPWVGAHPHMAVRSGWRINSYVLHNGSSTDTTYLRENWTDVNY
jgi:hypothetical protein